MLIDLIGEATFSIKIHAEIEGCEDLFRMAIELMRGDDFIAISDMIHRAQHNAVESAVEGVRCR